MAETRQVFRAMENIHPAGPLPLTLWQQLFLGYACGLLGAVYFWSACLGLFLLGLATTRERGAFLLGGVFVLGLAVGGSGHDPPAEFWNSTAQISGVVEEVRTYPGGRVNIVAGQVEDVSSGKRLSGRLLWTLDGVPSTPETGSRFEANLRVRALRGRVNFGLPGSEQYWARKNVWHRAYSRGDADASWPENTSLRSVLMAQVEALLPPGDGGATIQALLFGDRLGLEPMFMDRIRRAGLAHSLALSGLHLGLVAAFGFGAAWMLGAAYPPLLLQIPRQKLGIILALPVAAAYLWLGGFAPSLQRALLMLVVMAMHQLSGTRRSLQDSLLWAAFLLVLLDPGAVHDVSLQLSVLAVAGIVLFLPLFHLPRLRGKMPPPVTFLFTLGAVTVCANLFLLPVQILYFSEFPALLALNLLWLPVLSLVTLPLCFGGLVLSFFWDSGAQNCFWLAGRTVDTLSYGLQILDEGGWLKAVAVLRPHGVQVLGYWTALVAGSALLSRFRAGGKPLIFLGLGLALLVTPSAWQTLKSTHPRIEMTVLDTGMSQAVFVRTTTGRTLLFDGAGAWGTGYDPGRAVVGPSLAWGHPPRVDMVFLSHMDADHARGLFYILDAFAVGFFGWPGLWDETEDSARLQSVLERGTWPVRTLRRGDRIEVEPGLWLEVLHPSREYDGISSNDSSLVLRLVWQGKGLALLPGDTERRALGEMLRGGVPLQAEVLVLPHHGSRSGLSSRWYDAVGATWAVAACGFGNRFGFPHPEVVAACEERGMRVLTTAQYGAIRFSWAPEAPVQVRLARFSDWVED